MENNKILEKLRKLMNLEESARSLGNEGEANAAAAGISRLLMEYNLSLDDIPDEEKLENPVVSEEIPYKAELSNGPWYGELVRVVCTYNFCRPLVISKYHAEVGRWKRDTFEIVGRKKNVEVVLYLISFLAHRFVSAGRSSYSSYKYRCIRQLGINPATPSKYMKSFLIGCVDGLAQKLQDSAEVPETAEKISSIIVSTTAEIDEFLIDRKIGQVRQRTVFVNSQAIAEGMKTGRNVEIHKGIHQDSVPETCLLS